MPNKNRTRRKVVVKQPNRKPKKATPFSDAGAIVGSGLGTMFNAPYLKGVGKWLGSGIGQIFGSGDYQVVGSVPSYNVLMNGAQTPSFSSTKQTNVVCHREYLGDFTGTAGFFNNTFPLNPGIASTFPWLSTIAQNYQEYKFHGLIFEFRPLITDFVTNGAPGVVVMATNYNADAPAYATKQEMENSEYAVSVKPTRELMHGVECATAQTVLPQLYVRTGVPPVGQDLRLYDLGLFQFATQTNPIQNLGELWVSYCIEFFKPILPIDVGGNVLGKYILRSGIAPAAPLGTIETSSHGDLNAFAGINSVIWVAQPGNLYDLIFEWEGSIAGPATYPGTTFTGLTPIAAFNGATSYVAPGTAVVTTRMMFHFIVRCDLVTPASVSVVLNAAGTYPTGTTTVFISVGVRSSESV
jgi:hypothetical protein